MYHQGLKHGLNYYMCEFSVVFICLDEGITCGVEVKDLGSSFGYGRLEPKMCKLKLGLV